MQIYVFILGIFKLQNDAFSWVSFIFTVLITSWGLSVFKFTTFSSVKFFYYIFEIPPMYLSLSSFSGTPASQITNLHWATISFVFWHTALGFVLHSGLSLQLYLPNFLKNFKFQPSHFLNYHEFIFGINYSFHTCYVNIVMLYVSSQLSLKYLKVL